MVHGQKLRIQWRSYSRLVKLWFWRHLVHDRMWKASKRSSSYSPVKLTDISYFSCNSKVTRKKGFLVCSSVLFHEILFCYFFVSLVSAPIPWRPGTYVPHRHTPPPSYASVRTLDLNKITYKKHGRKVHHLFTYQ